MVRMTRLENSSLQIIDKPTRLPEKKALIISLNYYNSKNPEFGNCSEATAFANSIYLYLHFTNIKILSNKPSINENTGDIKKSDIIKSLDELFIDFVAGDVVIILILGKRNKDGLIQINNDEFFNKDELQKLIVYPIQNGVTVALFLDTICENNFNFIEQKQDCTQRIGLRYLHEKHNFDTKKVIKSSALLGYRIPIEIEFLNNQILTTEYVDKEDTCSTFLAVCCSSKKSALLTFALTQIFTNNYLHTLSLKKFIKEIASFFIVNLVNNNNGDEKKMPFTFYLESGQHIDMHVPLGRIFSAPL
jgi:hypothetical protein